MGQSQRPRRRAVGQFGSRRTVAGAALRLASQCPSPNRRLAVHPPQPARLQSVGSRRGLAPASSVTAFDISARTSLHRVDQTPHRCLRPRVPAQAIAPVILLRAGALFPHLACLPWDLTRRRRALRTAVRLTSAGRARRRSASSVVALHGDPAQLARSRCGENEEPLRFCIEDCRRGGPLPTPEAQAHATCSSRHVASDARWHSVL